MYFGIDVRPTDLQAVIILVVKHPNLGQFVSVYQEVEEEVED